MKTHSIIVVKNDKNEYLQYFDERWDSYLFLNCKLSDGNDIDTVKEKISGSLNIEKEYIECLLVGSRKHEKFSESDKVYKEYNHYFYKATLDKKLKDNEFDINGVNYKWFSYIDLINDERIRKVNSDIVQFVKELNM